MNANLVSSLHNHLFEPGTHILENTLPPGGGGGYQPMSFGGKNMKRRREKRKNIKEKEERGKEMRKGEVNG